MKALSRLVYEVTPAFLLLSLVGCAGSTKSSETSKEAPKEVVENKPAITVSDLPTNFLDAVDTSSERSIKNKLKNQDSLVLDGTTLTVGNVGDNRTVTLAFQKLVMRNGARIITNGKALPKNPVWNETRNVGLRWLPKWPSRQRLLWPRLLQF